MVRPIDLICRFVASFHDYFVTRKNLPCAAYKQQRETLVKRCCDYVALGCEKKKTSLRFSFYLNNLTYENSFKIFFISLDWFYFKVRADNLCISTNIAHAIKTKKFFFLFLSIAFLSWYLFRRQRSVDMFGECPNSTYTFDSPFIISKKHEP